MNNYLDFHIHSYYSDGDRSPAELVRIAKKENFKVISLTDHNTIGGVKEFLKAGSKYKIKTIPGIEVYTRYKKHLLHILLYNFDINNKKLGETLNKLCQKKYQLLLKSIRSLIRRGFIIKAPSLKDSYYPSVTLITNQLINNQNNLNKLKKITKQSKPEFFTIINKLFTKKKPGYLPEVALPLEKFLLLIRKTGGTPILAHPGQQFNWRQDPIIQELKKLGIRGLEVFSPYHNWHEIEHYQEIALKLKMIITGGSDYHGDLSQPNLIVTKANDYFKIPFQLINNLKKL